MGTVLLVIHMILALAIIGLVLIQRSEGGGLGIGGGGGGLGNFATPRSTANALTRATALCVAGFFATSLILGILAGTQTRSKGILETYGVETPKTPVAPVSGDASSAPPSSSAEGTNTAVKLQEPEKTEEKPDGKPSPKVSAPATLTEKAEKPAQNPAPEKSSEKQKAPEPPPSK